VASHGTDYERYSAAITSNGFDGSVVDMLDMNDVTQLMQSMGISISHGLRLKATFASWKKHPDAAFEALALAKVTAVLMSTLCNFMITCRLPPPKGRKPRLPPPKSRCMLARHFLISTL
jgi:hypothetical protein